MRAFNNRTMNVVIMVPDSYLRLALTALLQKYGTLFDVTGVFNTLSELRAHLQHKNVDHVITACCGIGETFQDWFAFYREYNQMYRHKHMVVIDNAAALHIHRAVFLYPGKLVGYLNKKSHINDFMTCLFETFVHESSPTMPANVDWDVMELSPTEADVIKFYLMGLSTVFIAQRVNKTVKSISYYKRKAMRKLGVTRAMELMYFAS